jgi:hypothetical protein
MKPSPYSARHKWRAWRRMSEERVFMDDQNCNRFSTKTLYNRKDEFNPICGVYRFECAENDDPHIKGRICMRVPSKF